MRPMRVLGFIGFCQLFFTATLSAQEADLPANQWVELCKDSVGGRRGSSFRYVPGQKTFFLWGFQSNDYEFGQENEAMTVPEHDMVAFDWATKRWRNHLPEPWAADWAKKLPPVFVPRCYHGITTGSERSLFRPPIGYPEEAARPDANIVFDQVVYFPPEKSLVYFTGGLTVAYDPAKRRWTNRNPKVSPPPVIGGALTYDPVHQEILLCGGGNVVEIQPGGSIKGCTGTWAYSWNDNTWRLLPGNSNAHVNSRAVTDTKRQELFCFGGDLHWGYSGYSRWMDLKTRQWKIEHLKQPLARAGHFTLYDPKTGWILLGGGYHFEDLTDLWAFDPGKQSWRKLPGDVPTGFDIAADFDPDRRVILLTTNTKKPGDGRRCDVLYPVRTTYAYRLEEATLPPGEAPMPLKDRTDSAQGLIANQREFKTDTLAAFRPDPKREKERREILQNLPINQWVHLKDPIRPAPARTWGSAAFDTDRGHILYWGGGHCGYGGSDVDSYSVDRHSWSSNRSSPPRPHRLWHFGVRLAGVNLLGDPFTEHGRKIYAYDPVSKKMILAVPIRLTTGYVPEALKDYPGEPRAAVDAKVQVPTTYKKYATWVYDPELRSDFRLAGPAPRGVDTLVSTKHGVVGVEVDWPSRLNDAGYLLPYQPSQAKRSFGMYRYDEADSKWTPLGGQQAGPQNLYEMTALAYDSQRDRIYLHGGGVRRDELWTFDMKAHAWKHLDTPGPSPIAQREMVYLPRQDVLLAYGPDEGKATLWEYRPVKNAWKRVPMNLPPDIDPRTAAGQNRAMVYDPIHDLVLLVLGGGGDRGLASVYALRYRAAEK